MTGGFGHPTPNPDNEWITFLAVFGGNLYAGTINWRTGGEIWRWNDICWTQVLAPGTPHGFTVANTEITSLAKFDLHLFVGTENRHGAEVWKSPDGSITWTQANTGGFGHPTPNPDNEWITSLAVFGGNLYAGTANWHTGGEIRRTSGVAPTVTISSTVLDPTGTSPIPMTATFSEAVTGFVVGDIGVTNGAVTVGSFAGTGTVYTFTVTPTVYGLVSVDITPGAANNEADNPNTAAPTFNIIFVPPVTVAPGNGCFIATAAFGTPLAEEIEVLSRLRDEYLLTNELGQRVVAFYERHSLQWAEFISEREWAKRVVRIALWPVVRIAELVVD